MVPVVLSRNQRLLVLALFPAAFVLSGFIVDSPAAIFRGLVAILTSRDTLITDYIGVGGLGAAFVNAGLLTLLALACYWLSGAVIGGAAVACLFLVLGFALVPCAAHLFNAHLGYTLYNIGWVAGILGTLTVAVYKSYGFVPDPVFI